MISPDQYINIHTHRKAQSSGEYCIRNAFHYLDEKSISRLGYPVSVGIHPWHAGRADAEVFNRLLRTVFLPEVMALGEIGLDRVAGPSLRVQLEVFEQQLEIAAQAELPLIIHSVRTISDLVPYVKRSGLPFVFHRYSGNAEQTRSLLGYNTFFSFGPQLFRKDPLLAELLALIPADRIFLETDTQAVTIGDVYRQFLLYKQGSLQALQKQVFSNFAAVFSAR